MRKILTTAVAAAILSAGALLSTSAGAITLTAPTGVRTAIDQTNSVEKAGYVCYRVWRHGKWTRKCGWDGPRYSSRYYYGGYPYYYGYRPYYYGPYAYYPYRRPGVGLYFRF